MSYRRRQNVGGHVRIAKVHDAHRLKPLSGSRICQRAKKVLQGRGVFNPSSRRLIGEYSRERQNPLVRAETVYRKQRE